MELLHRILEGARGASASDVHLKSGSAPVFRIHGELRMAEAPPVTAGEIEAMIETVLPPAVREVFDREHEADVSFESRSAGRFRVNVFRQRGVPCLAIRAVKDTVPSFEALALPRPLMESLCNRASGLVLLAGATGAGKSTTLAALVSRINETERRHIITIEDPIEFLFEDRRSIIEQREIGLDTRDFPAALRRIIRQDPDVIVIGEMRDAESFRAGISAAETGHLVLATLHANDVRQAVDRVLDFFPAGERESTRRQLGVALAAILCQRLVPAVKEGVVPALEVLVNTETVRKLFQKDRLEQIDIAISQGRSDRMQTFDQSFYALVQEGRISRETALAHATSSEQLAMNFRGIFASEGRLIGG